MSRPDAQTSRPEAAFVLLVLQATFWAGAGVSAFPFVLAGEVFMLGLGLASLLLAGSAVALAIGLVRRRRGARRWTLVLEWLSVAGSLLLLLVPLGANRGPVSLLVNVALPLAVILLLRGKRMKSEYQSPRQTQAPAHDGAGRLSGTV
jgi:hypothetical protein